MSNSSYTRSELLNLLKNGLTEINQTYSTDIESQLIRYVELLYQENPANNLTPVRDQDMIITRYVLESLSILPYLKSKNILDVGTGAGIPGLILAIALPAHQFVLLDRNAKKIQFLQKVCEGLNLTNVQIIESEIQDYHPDKLFDDVICRSFGEIPFVLDVIEPLLNPNAQILMMKGVNPQMEIEWIKKPFNLIKVNAIKVPNLEDERHLVEVNFTPA